MRETDDLCGAGEAIIEMREASSSSSSLSSSGEAIIEMREAENGGDSSESEVEGGEEVGYLPIPALHRPPSLRKKQTDKQQRR